MAKKNKWSQKCRNSGKYKPEWQENVRRIHINVSVSDGGTTTSSSLVPTRKLKMSVKVKFVIFEVYYNSKVVKQKTKLFLFRAIIIFETPCLQSPAGFRAGNGVGSSKVHGWFCVTPNWLCETEKREFPSSPGELLLNLPESSTRSGLQRLFLLGFVCYKHLSTRGHCHVTRSVWVCVWEKCSGNALNGDAGEFSHLVAHLRRTLTKCKVLGWMEQITGHGFNGTYQLSFPFYPRYVY